MRQYGQRILKVGLTNPMGNDPPVYMAVLLDLPNEMTDFTVKLRLCPVNIARFIVRQTLPV